MTAIDLEGVLRDLDEQRKTREGASITTAFNVVAFVEDDPELEAVIAERIDQLEQRNPSRSLILTVSDGRPKIGMEHVELCVQDLAAPQLQSVVRELLIPSVRTVLLWAGDRITDPRFTALGDLADVVVTFTSRTADYETQALADLVAMQNTPIGPKLRDLAFLRLGCWQDLVAEFFDDEELMPELERLDFIEVRAGNESEAYYFVGWLASRLDWQPCGKHEFCNTAGESIRVSLKREGRPRHMQGVKLRSRGTTFEVNVHKETSELVCLSVEGEKRRPERCSPLNEPDMVSLVERAIFLPSDNTIYRETLTMVGRLLQHLT